MYTYIYILCVCIAIWDYLGVYRYTTSQDTPSPTIVPSHIIIISNHEPYLVVKTIYRFSKRKIFIAIYGMAHHRHRHHHHHQTAITNLIISHLCHLPCIIDHVITMKHIMKQWHLPGSCHPCHPSQSQ